MSSKWAVFILTALHSLSFSLQGILSLWLSKGCIGSGNVLPVCVVLYCMAWLHHWLYQYPQHVCQHVTLWHCMEFHWISLSGFTAILGSQHLRLCSTFAWLHSVAVEWLKMLPTLIAMVHYCRRLISNIIIWWCFCCTFLWQLLALAFIAVRKHHSEMSKLKKQVWHLKASWVLANLLSNMDTLLSVPRTVVPHLSVVLCCFIVRPLALAADGGAVSVTLFLLQTNSRAGQFCLVLILRMRSNWKD